ncbi:MAG: capsular biosynthesis protein [Rubrimonas sp.]|uniref:capsule biosynthesis protein n=1 Tax=Rubrimonas sp. TaxID=2036015 RepID=UPI002FDD3024
MAPHPPARTVLFLQGPPSRLWVEIADALEARGARALRVDLCLADQLWWRRGGAVAYRGRLRHWRRWLTAFTRREGVTDILYYADRLPYHRIAAKVARAEGIAAHALEFGYLRPDWLTLEREGGGAWSHFPQDPALMRADAPAPDFAIRYPHDFRTEAVAEVAYNLIMTAGRPLFPFYASDKFYAPIFDYLCWLPKLATERRRRARAARVQAACAEGRWPYTLVALQMQSDYQLRHSAPFHDQGEMIDEILRSFAAHAASDHRLVFKLHPLDNGWENWPARAARSAAALGVADRVLVLDGGDLGALIGGAQGVIVANSTVGLHALRAGAPVKALGAAVYDMAGLTHQGPLDGFWRAPPPPEPDLLRRFTATLAAEIQVKGSVYHPEGRRLAAAEVAARIVEGRVGPASHRGEPHAVPPRIRALKAAWRKRREVRARG